MRRVTTWLLVLALALLAACLLWLLPRLLREEPPPEQNLAATSPADAAPDLGPAPESTGDPGSSASGGSGTAALPPADNRVAEEATDAARAGAEHVRTTGSVRGRVLDRAGKSVPGILVMAAHAQDLGAPVRAEDFWLSHLPLDVADPAALGAETPSSTTTDELGNFRFDAFEPGRVRLAVRSPRHAPLDRNDLRLGAGHELDAGDLVLDAPAWIDGVLLDAENRPVRKAPVVLGDALAGAKLPVLSPGRGVRLGETEVRGRFRAGPVHAGPQRIEALGAPDFEDVAFDVPDAGAGGEYLATVPDADAIRGQLLGRGSDFAGLLVRALPAETARGPVPFDARADGRSASVQRNGAFEIDGLAHGTLYELRAGSPLDRFEDATAWSPPAFATAGEFVRVRWSSGASISFRLVDTGGAFALGACRLDFERALPASVLLASAEGPREVGSAEVPREVGSLRPTTSSPFVGVLVQSRGSGPASRTAELASGSTVDLGAIEMRPLPRLGVHVVEGETKKPIRGARVTATETSTGLDASGLDPVAVVTNATGDASVSSYAGAASRVVVEAAGYARTTRLGPFGFGYGSPRLELALARGATARVRVLDEGDTPIAGARVEWVEGDWTPPARPAAEPPIPISERPDPRTSRLTDADGRVVFADLAPGRHAFRVQRRRPKVLDGEWTQREIRAGDVEEIELRSVAPASLDLRIVDGGAPLAGAPVCLLRAEDAARCPDLGEIENDLPPGIDARLDDRGRAVFRELDAPAVDVLAVLVPGQSRRACFPLRLRGGATSLTLDLSVAAVTGTVVDADKAPVANAEIFVADEMREGELRARGRRRTLLDASAAGLAALAIERPAATTDAEGRFRIVGLPLDASFALVARALRGEGGSSASGRSEPIVLRSNEGGRDVAITVAPAGTLVVRTRSAPDSGPCTLVASSSAVPKGPGALLPRIRRVYPGRSEVLYGLAPGTWDLETVSDDRQLRDRLRVEVAAGEVREVEPRVP